MAKQVMENFSREEEELVRKFLFTNPHGKESLVYPQPLVAGEELSPLMSAVSRTHVDMQTRVLQFLDRQKAEQTRAMLPYMTPLMDIFRHPDGTLKISKRTKDFNKEYVILHSHASIKEGTMLFGHVEDISDITGKKITGHPLMHPQVKSTRYITYDRVLPLAEQDQDLLALKNPERFIEYQKMMNKKYVDITDRLAEKVYDTDETRAMCKYFSTPEMVEVQFQRWLENRLNVDEEFKISDEDALKEKKKIYEGWTAKKEVVKDIEKFVLDSSRVYLTAATRTSLVFASDARTLEETITEMISSIRKEDQERGHALWKEAKKIAPLLLGEKSHINVDQWKVKNEIELRGYMEEKFGDIQPRKKPDGMVTVLHPDNIRNMFSDRFNAALTVFPYVDASLQDIMDALHQNDVKEVLAKAHQHRDQYDVIHPAIAHGGLMFENVMGYHGYRDMFRHRRGSRSVQLLTTRLGFEHLDILKHFGLSQEYERDMLNAATVFEEGRAQSPHTAEKLVPFGALCRSLHSWQVNQVGYMGKLRADIAKGNLSYVYMMRELVDEVSKLMPETAQYFRVDRKDYPAHVWKKGYEWFDKSRKS